MTDFGKLNQCVMLTKALAFLPPPARTSFAEGLYDLGVRLHPELATKQLVARGPAGMGEHRPRHLVAVDAQQDMSAMVERFTPDLARRIAAAKTDEEKAEMRAYIRAHHPEIIEQAEQQLAADPEEQP